MKGYLWVGAFVILVLAALVLFVWFRSVYENNQEITIEYVSEYPGYEMHMVSVQQIKNILKSLNSDKAGSLFSLSGDDFGKRQKVEVEKIIFVLTAEQRQFGNLSSAEPGSSISPVYASYGLDYLEKEKTLKIYLHSNVDSSGELDVVNKNVSGVVMSALYFSITSYPRTSFGVQEKEFMEFARSFAGSVLFTVRKI